MRTSSATAQQVHHLLLHVSTRMKLLQLIKLALCLAVQASGCMLWESVLHPLASARAQAPRPCSTAITSSFGQDAAAVKNSSDQDCVATTRNLADEYLAVGTSLKSSVQRAACRNQSSEQSVDFIGSNGIVCIKGPTSLLLLSSIAATQLVMSQTISLS